MALQNVFLFVQAGLYAFTFILAFFICIPTGVNVEDFNGHCLLYASGDWVIHSKHEGPHLDNMNWGVESACNFTIFIGVLSMMMSLFYTFWSSVLLSKGLESSWVDAFLNLIVNCVMSICIFSDALTVSVGFNEWCRLITEAKSGIDSCEDAQSKSIFIDINIHHSTFYTQWQVVQFGVWSSWIIWLLLSIMSLGRMIRYNRHEAISVSINRERQKLIQKIGNRTDPI